jgi:hypothetical protein
MSKTITYKGNEITLVPVAHRIIDVYINAIPRICRNTPWECITDAKQIIEVEGKAR